MRRDSFIDSVGPRSESASEHLVTLWALVRGNPGGISDAQYSEFSRLAPPKLLYSCTRKRTQESLLREIHESANSGRSGCDQKPTSRPKQRPNQTLSSALRNVACYTLCAPSPIPRGCWTRANECGDRSPARCVRGQSNAKPVVRSPQFISGAVARYSMCSTL
jgi:hypothetical protein